MSRLSSINRAVEAIAAGKPVIVVDDENRENEGDLIAAAEFVTTETMGFMVRYTSGVICAPITAARAAELALPPMIAVNEDPKGTAYTVSCDAATGVSTGISAADRALTCRVLADPVAGAASLNRPGHVFPLIARDGGVRERPGHTEAAVELARLAGSRPAGVIAELVHDDGSMMRVPALIEFAAKEGLHLISIEQLAAYLDERDATAEHPAVATDPSATETADSPAVGGEPVTIPTQFGSFTGQAWTVAGREYLTLSSAGVGAAVGATDDAPLVRVHSECLTGDVFHSYRCDCGEQLELALRTIDARGGTLIYMAAHEGRGIGLVNKLRAYKLQDEGLDTLDANLRLGLPADARSYEPAVHILQAMGIDRLRLLTNNPAKSNALRALGIDVVEAVPNEVPARESNVHYLETKRDRMHHDLHLLPQKLVKGQ